MDGAPRSTPTHRFWFQSLDQRDWSALRSAGQPPSVTKAGELPACWYSSPYAGWFSARLLRVVEAGAGSPPKTWKEKRE